MCSCWTTLSKIFLKWLYPSNHNLSVSVRTTRGIEEQRNANDDDETILVQPALISSGWVWNQSLMTTPQQSEDWRRNAMDEVKKREEIAEERKRDAASVRHAYIRHILEEGIPQIVHIKRNPPTRISDPFVRTSEAKILTSTPIVRRLANSDPNQPCKCTCGSFPHEKHYDNCQLLRCMYNVIRDGTCKVACRDNFHRIVCGCKNKFSKYDYSCGLEKCPNPHYCKGACSSFVDGRSPCSPICTRYGERCPCVKTEGKLACEYGGCPNSRAECGCYK